VQGRTQPGQDVAVIGGGHVGLVTGACLAAVGHRVRVQDIDRDRVERLARGELPFLEPDLGELLAQGLENGRLSFHVDPAGAVPTADVIFVCVDTPNRADGAVDLSALVAATRAAARHARPYAVLVNRSTAPVGTSGYAAAIAWEERSSPLSITVNPEFLAEGTAVRDFLAPDRVVVGAWDRAEADRVLEVYGPILERLLPDTVPHHIRQRAEASGGPVPALVMDPPTAELTKYAANAFLAVKISFINEIASISEEIGGDVVQVARAIGLDRRVGPHFLRAGVGWGGSCFPKDIVALQGMAETRGLAARMLQAAHEVNREQHRWVVRRLQRHLKTLVGRRIGLLGLSFKPGTDDLRNAPALDIAVELTRLSARVRAFDPVVKALPPGPDGVIELVESPEALAEGAEALVLVTEWAQFAELDWLGLRRRMRTPLLLDGRNVLDPDAARAAGFTYVGVGRADGMPGLDDPVENGHIDRAGGSSWNGGPRATAGSILEPR
jgi:UDPglucose 6-dehydrogenase